MGVEVLVKVGISVYMLQSISKMTTQVVTIKYYSLQY